MMKSFTGIFCALAVGLAAIVPTEAQTAPPESPTPIKEATEAEVGAADVAFTANITASEVKYSQVGSLKVEFAGMPERKTIWEEDRQNLPKNPQSGVIYRNVGIQLRVTSRFAEIEKIVADAISGKGTPPLSPAVITTSEPKNGVAWPAVKAPLPPKPVLPPKAVIPVSPKQ